MEDRHIKLLYSLVGKLVRERFPNNYDFQQEIIQRTIIRLYKQNHNYYAQSYIKMAINSSATDIYREKHKRNIDVEFCILNEKYCECQLDFDDSVEIFTDIDKIIASLPQKEAYIVTEHALNKATFKEIASIFGLKRQRIHQIYHKTIDKLTEIYGRPLFAE